MSALPELRLKKNEDRRLRAGHAWVHSNEVDTKKTPFLSLHGICIHFQGNFQCN